MTDKQQKLIDILKEMFQLNQSDLDFGIYRIMNAKADEITTFLEKDLVGSIKDAFSASGTNPLQVELDEAIASARSLGVDPETIPKVQELRVKLSGTSDSTALENEVYSHLATFFSRYYKDGDFVSLRRYKKDTYAIPYEGEEVKLHWANSDQYYIKTSEYFKDYTFKVTGSNGLIQDEEKTIHFKLKDADTESNNNKASGDKERRFVIADDTVAEEIDGEFYIYFEYKAVGKLKQDNLNKEALESITALEGFDAFKSLLITPAPTEKNKNRTLLEKHLKSYTSRNSFDYFIHKDLGGFLSRELDFYIKNEMLFIDDIENASTAKIEESLGKMKTFKSIAKKIIVFLTQIEEFQKSLWLKKKFIIETNYCITLDKIDEKYYEEILACNAQLEEWVSLFDVKVESLDDLNAEPYLVLDTKFFDGKFKNRLLAEFDDLDEEIDGVLISSENNGALSLMQERYKQQIKFTYIDPPYNTGGDGFFYKDAYKHSSWLTMIFERLKYAYTLISADGVLYSSIDAVERASLESVLNLIFQKQNRVEEVIWAQNTTKNQSPTFSTNHEYVEVYAKSLETVKKDYSMFRESKPGYTEIMELIHGLNPKYLGVNEIEVVLRKLFKDRKQKLKEEGISPKDDEWKSIYNYNKVEYRDSKGKYVPETLAESKSALIWVWREVDTSMPQVKEDSQKDEFRDPDSPTYRFYNPMHPITNQPCPSPKTGWRWPYNPHGKQKNYFVKLSDDDRIVWGENEKKIPQQKSFLHEVETNVSKSVVNDYADGEKELTNIFGKSRSFSNPKPTSLIARFCSQSVAQNNIVFDFFSGSGTTGHAAIKLNREDNGKRKYILVEMGEYFDTVTKSRIQKVIYTDNWEDGKPQDKDGISQVFKYFKLESYEDTLNNLAFKRTDQQKDLLSSNPTLKEDYMLNYMLDYESSQSQLAINSFAKPFDYKLNISAGSAGETKETTVDLVETFNYLIGLKIKSRHVTKEYLVIEGENLKGEKILIIWREGNDNKALNSFFGKMDFSVYDREFDTIYVNGDNNLANLKKDEDHYKVKLIEEEFKRLMFNE